MIKRLRKIIFLMIITISFTFCKKNNVSNNNSGVIPNNNNPGYYGIITIFNQQTLWNGSISPATSQPIAEVYFSNSPTTFINQLTYTKVNSVSINNNPYQFFAYVYEDTSSARIITLPYTIVVSGFGSIPSFSYTNNTPLPGYLGYTSLPDTIFKSQNITIPIIGLTGSDLTTISIGSGATTVTQTLTPGSTSVQFSSSILSSLSVGSDATIAINCVKNNVQTFGGKLFNFSNLTNFNKTIFIK